MLRIILICIFSFQVLFAQNWDINTLDRINSRATPFKDRTFKFISNTVTPVTIAAPVSMITAGFITGDSSLKYRAIFVTASISLETLLKVGLKSSIKRTRPFDMYTFIEKKDSPHSYSFPSGHTSAAFAVATSLSLSYPKWYVIVPAYAWAGLVAYSRMYLGVHFPTDVLGGIVVGVGASFISWHVQKIIVKNSR